MDVLVVLLLIAALGVGVAGLLEARRSRTPIGERSPSPDVRSERAPDGGLVLSVPEGVLATLSFAPQADVVAADVDRSPALIAAVNELARAVPDVL